LDDSARRPVDARSVVDPGRHEWDRLVGGWHVVFGVLATLTAVLLALDSGIGVVRRSLALTMLALLCAWYLATGARALHREPDRLGTAYLLGAAPLTLGLYAVHPIGAVMLFVLFPHLWVLQPARRAIAGTAAAVAVIAAVMLAQVELDPGPWSYILVTATVALLVAIVLGLWITRVIEQSRQRADLVSQLETTRAELAAVSHRSGVLAERERLARDIHDTLAQGFTSVLLLLEAAEVDLGRAAPTAVRERLERARHIVRENLDEARAMVAALTPPQLRDSSLPAALRQVVEGVGPELAGRVDLTVQGDPGALPASHEVVLLRAAQEALANAGKHAAANKTEVRLEYHQGRVALRVSDDGRGFDQARCPGGYGLAGLRERVSQVGGSMHLVTAPGAGVTLSVELHS
jgi:signal transduction histidine kinase